MYERVQADSFRGDEPTPLSTTALSLCSLTPTAPSPHRHGPTGSLDSDQTRLDALSPRGTRLRCSTTHRSNQRWHQVSLPVPLSLWPCADERTGKGRNSSPGAVSVSPRTGQSSAHSLHTTSCGVQPTTTGDTRADEAVSGVYRVAVKTDKRALTQEETQVSRVDRHDPHFVQRDTAGAMGYWEVWDCCGMKHRCCCAG